LVIIAGSTLKGEEEPVIRAFNRIRTVGTHALLIVAARHPERFDEVERICRHEGLSTVRRSELPIDAEPRADAVVLDTIGELAQLYQVATVVFIGGSLVPAGGHNILEPALYGKPVVFGPHMQNFGEIAETFMANGAAIQVRSEGELEDTLVSLVGDPVRRARVGAAARALVESNRGAGERTMAVIGSSFPRNPLTGERRHGSHAGLLSGMYGRVTQARRAWYSRRPDRRRRLRHPVISVGNLVSGGSGKTPVVAAIARRLRERGERPVILTRGYGRREHVEGVLVVSDGERVLEPVARSGDEPQLLARTLEGIPILVSSDRYLAGSLAERQFGATVSLLDDGFQHVQLERDIDLLLVSAGDLDDRVLPSGHLREPLAAARIADALLVTGEDDEVTQVARELGHESAFRVVPRYGSLYSAGRAFQARQADPQGPPRIDQRIVAFAGIARPERFFNALRMLGWDVTRALTFRDHHWFTARDVETIQRAARESGASAIITTEKDAVRLPAGTRDIPILVLAMTVGVEPAGVFESWLFERLARARACRLNPPAEAPEARSRNARSSEG
jgi:tetraacyldisaccharide 4'-kinase